MLSIDFRKCASKDLDNFQNIIYKELKSRPEESGK